MVDDGIFTDPVEGGHERLILLFHFILAGFPLGFG